MLKIFKLLFCGPPTVPSKTSAAALNNFRRTHTNKYEDVCM